MGTERNDLEQYCREVNEIKASAELKARLKETLNAELQKDHEPGNSAGTVAWIETNSDADFKSDIASDSIAATEVSNTERKRKMRYHNALAGAAAIICLLAATTFMWNYLQPQEEDYIASRPDDPNGNNSGMEQAVAFDWESAELVNGLPKVWVSSFSYGMGSGALAAYDVSEFENGNPWTEELKLETLPVFWNTARSDSAGLIAKGGLSDQAMIDKVNEIAGLLGLKTNEVQLSRDNEVTSSGSDELYEVSIESDGVKISLERNGQAEIFFEDRNTATPGTISKAAPTLRSYPENPSSREDFDLVTEELYQQFKDLFGWDSCASSVSGDRFFDGGMSWWEAAYDNAGNITEQILGYNFRKISYAVRDKKLWILRLTDTDLSAKLGDYPVITASQALEELLNGNYISVEPEYKPQEGKIEKVELEYLNERFQEYFVPCYKFYVEMPQMTEDYNIAEGLKMYAVYYVPAIESQYLSVVDELEVYFN